MEVREVSVYEAKTHLSRLLRQVEAGEEIVIRRGKSVIARIVPAEATVRISIPDRAKGEVWIADDFDEPLDEFSEYRT